MWFWRRREIYVGNSLEEFNRIRNLLEAHHIRCDYKTDSHMKAEWTKDLSLWNGWEATRLLPLLIFFTWTGKIMLLQKTYSIPHRGKSKKAAGNPAARGVRNENSNRRRSR